MGALNQVLSTLQYAAQPDITLRSYQHASKIFGPNNNSLAPKTKNWFHVYFQVNPAVVSLVNQSLSQAVTNHRINWNPANLPVLGVLAKTVGLPNIKIETTKNNQYNKWSLTQTKINYEPISITFWNDTINVIQHFWYAYYQYMNQDPNYVNWSATQTQGINVPKQWAQSLSPLPDSVTTVTGPSVVGGSYSSIYNDSTNWAGSFGMDTVNTTKTGTQLVPAPGSSFNRIGNFFSSIQIYQFNRAVNPNGVEYSEFALVNPVITGFSNDDLDSSSSDFTTNKMDIEYETVLYNNGYLNNDEIASWDAVTSTLFDNTPSPLGQPSNSIQSVSGIASSVISSVTSSYALANQISQNKGGITSVNTVLSQATQIGTITNNLTGLVVPSATPAFGSSGAPPLSVGV